jgi:tellurite resistance protein TerC
VGRLRVLEAGVGAWAVFAAVVIVAIGIDVGVLHRRPGRISLKAAVVESAGWVALALGFGLWVYLAKGGQAGLEFFTGYLIEKSLSLDNVLLFLVVFQSFGVAAEYQHRVLYFGVIGALVMRAAFVFAGIALLQRFEFVAVIFGAILLIAGALMLWSGGRHPEAEERWAVQAVRWVFPVADNVPGGARFWIKRDGKWNATPLFLALVVIEVMDLIFAIDSVPAVLAVTRNPFIAYSSNVFAVLGLRAMYFALAALLPRFRFLHTGLAAILIFIGAKMVGGEHLPVSTGESLGVLAGILAIMVAASLLWPKRVPNSPQ